QSRACDAKRMLHRITSPERIAKLQPRVSLQFANYYSPQGLGRGVGRPLGVGTLLGVGVGRGVVVGVTVGVGVLVGVGVGGSVALGDGVGVGACPPGNTRT